MRTLVLIGALCACGGSKSGSADVDGGGGSGSGDGDAAQGAFCDGTPHIVHPSAGINGLAVDGSGRLLAVGTGFTGGQAMFALRLRADGTLDPAFGTSGVAKVTAPGLADGHSILVRADHSIVVGGGEDSSGSLKPFLAGLDDAGAPTGWTLSDPASQDSTFDHLFEQGTALIAVSDNFVRRVTPAGAFDAAFGTSGSLTHAGPVTTTTSGLATTVIQSDSFLTYRMTPDGANVANSAVSVPVPKSWQMAAVVARGDDVAFIGTATQSGSLAYDTYVGRVLANNTADTAAYPPAGVADLGTLNPRTGVERADGSLLLAAEPQGIVVVKPDGTIDRMLAVGTDPSKVSVVDVIDWNGHPTATGVVSGMGAYVACFP